MLRTTKIVATLGPASSSEEILGRLLQAGVDVVRLNFSHGTADDHRGRVQNLRSVAARLNRTVGIMADLQGPKIRVGKFENGRIELEAGATFILDTQCPLGNEERVGLDYPELIDDVEPGAVLLLDDGRIVLDVMHLTGHEIHTRVRLGGPLSNNKGINRQGGGLSAPALTSKDRQDIRTAADLGVDYVAVSFPKSGEDMRQARKLLQRAGSNALLVAKIERAEAIEALDDILEATDVVMVARGDLAVEVGDAAVPALQKRIIRAAREKNRVSITATQMMESMITSPVPTRAEVSDVANAVLDGTDAVMLSAETASGKFPVETVESMARICLEAEKSAEPALDHEMLHRVFTRVDQSIAHAATWIAHHLEVKAIAAMTESGSTALWMSRMHSGTPIYALTPVEATRNRLALFRGVFPILVSERTTDREELLRQAQAALLAHGYVQKGDLVVMTIGEPVGTPGGTNTLKIVEIGQQH